MTSNAESFWEDVEDDASKKLDAMFGADMWHIDDSDYYEIDIREYDGDTIKAKITNDDDKVIGSISVKVIKRGDTYTNLKITKVK